MFVGPKRVESLFEIPDQTVKEVAEQQIDKYAEKYLKKLELVGVTMIVGEEPMGLPVKAFPKHILEMGQRYQMEFKVVEEEPPEGPIDGEEQSAEAVDMKLSVF